MNLIQYYQNIQYGSFGDNTLPEAQCHFGNWTPVCPVTALYMFRAKPHIFQLPNNTGV